MSIHRNLSWIVLLLISKGLLSQQHKANRASTPQYSNSEFHGLVPPHYQGNNLRQIIDGLSHTDAGLKGEFETTAEYIARSEKADRQSLAGGIERDKAVAFVFPIDAMRKKTSIYPILESRYDADNASMVVSLHVTETNREYHRRELGSLSVLWDEKEAVPRHYRASNAFGAEMDITAFTSDLDGIAFPAHGIWNGHNTENIGTAAYPLQITFEVEPVKARLIATRLRALVICTVVAHAPLSTAQLNHTATFETEASSNNTFRYLHILPTELWIFDNVTGEVLAKSTTAFQNQIPINQ